MRKPNILLLLGDQHRADCTGYAGKYPVRTPNLDALCREGVCFTRAYTPIPVCAPARQALLSGRDPNSFGAMWNYDFVPTATLKPGACWTERLAEAGYRTAFLGKWHNSATHGPGDFGYRDYVSNDGYHRMIREKYPDLQYTGGWFGCESPLPVEDEHSHWLAGRAAELLRLYADSGEPFHIRVDFSDTHLPCRPVKPFSYMYRPEDMTPWNGFGDRFEGKPYIQKQQTVNWKLDGLGWEAFAPTVARYYASVTQLDDAVGRILAALEASGEAENTIVIYTADHGDMCGSHGMLDKHYVLYDDVVRVPLCIRFPAGAVRGGRVEDYVSNCLDIAPTLCELCGLPEGDFHGMSLVPYLRGGRPEQPRQYITSSSNGQQFGLYTQRMIARGNLKYIWNCTDTDELYDLSEDPGELCNRIRDNTYAGELAELRSLLLDQLKRQQDMFACTGWLDGQLKEGRKI